MYVKGVCLGEICEMHLSGVIAILVINELEVIFRTGEEVHLGESLGLFFFFYNTEQH